MKFSHPDAQWEWDSRVPENDPDQIPYCKETCPFYEAWKHPYYKHTVFCWHIMQNLPFHDGIIAACMVDYSEDSEMARSIRLSMEAKKRLVTQPNGG